MSTLEAIALTIGGAFVIYLMCAISYSIGLRSGIQYMTNVLRREAEESEDTEGEG